MGVFRSETIHRKRIRMPIESHIETMNLLGNLEQGSVEFIDLNKDDFDAKKNFLPLIKRCDEMDKKLINLENYAVEYSEKNYTYKSYRQFNYDLQQDMLQKDLRNGCYFDIVENEVFEDERIFTDLLESHSQTKANYQVDLEKLNVFEKSLELIQSEPQVYSKLDTNRNLEEGIGVGIQFLFGVIKAEDQLRMSRMVLRASQGCAVATFFNLKIIDSMIEKIPRKIFSIFYPAGTGYLTAKLINILDLFNCSRHNVPRSQDILTEIEILKNKIKEEKDVLKASETSIKNYLRTGFGTNENPGKLELYKMFFRKEKLIYVNLSKCVFGNNFIIGEIWILKKHYVQVAEKIKELESERIPISITDIKEKGVKPTHFEDNDFLWAFQEIVNTYGIPLYKEINPTYFNIVTFPFLFGVMFGDIGHGFILLLLGIYLTMNGNSIKKDPKSLLKSAAKARYLILFMGIFAFFCGWIYNDFFSLPFPVFNSCYQENPNQETLDKTSKDCVYPFGLDSAWRTARNELAFSNSFKMKVSVVLGVSHMLFGIVLKGLNEIYFKNWIGLFLEFIPQLLFMSCLFGYMIVMIFIKWATDWSSNTNQAPGLITQMLGIFLSFGSVQDKPLWGGKTGNHYSQEIFHKLIFIVAVILIPIMLVIKPLAVYLKHSRNKSESTSDRHSDEIRLNNEESDLNSEFNIQNNLDSIANHAEDNGEHSFSEIFVHSAIETIEFVLGCVSNTASYLRLWALSLAHGELSKVFFEKTLLGSVSQGEYFPGIISIIVGFFLFANVTFFVLMCMDLMECFLHTLRLHWVEFQSKFYKATGYKFNPFSFRSIVESD